jgi:outer membrane lipoprotein-sorting protein
MAMGYRKIILWSSVGLMAGLGTGLFAGEAAPSGQTGAGNVVFKDEPQARALFDQMMEALRRPQTLSYKSECRTAAQGQETERGTYVVWLKKPNQFRVEAARPDGRQGGTLIGDGESLWIFWPGDRPRFVSTDQEYEKTRSKVYMKEATPLAKHSIAHKVGNLGVPASGLIIDPSTFHGYSDSLMPYFDGATGMGTDKVADEDCDVIEASFMKHQRSWYLWLSQKDHLPRKVKEVVRVSYEIISHETWSDIVIDGAIPADRFVWTPPEGWQQWKMPDPEELLLKPGTAAPDFELTALDGRKIKLSDFRDKIVWLYVWRAG